MKHRRPFEISHRGARSARGEPEDEEGREPTTKDINQGTRKRRTAGQRRWRRGEEGEEDHKEKECGREEGSG